MKSFKDLIELISEKKQDTVANKPISVGSKLPWYATGKNPLTSMEMSKVPPAPKQTSSFSYGHMGPAAEKPVQSTQPTTTPTAPEPAKQSKVIKMGPSSSPPQQKKGPQPSALYTVQKDESFEAIAKRHGLSVSELMSINKGVKDPLKVPAGTQIRTRK
jgi:LysM repeat protein